MTLAKKLEFHIVIYQNNSNNSNDSNNSNNSNNSGNIEMVTDSSSSNSSSNSGIVFHVIFRRSISLQERTSLMLTCTGMYSILLYSLYI